MAPSAARIQVTSTRAVVDAASRRGVDRQQLLSDHGILETTLSDPDARLPAGQVIGLWLDAMDRAAEPQLPVIAAMELPWGDYRVIDYLCANAETLGEAFQLLGKVFGIVNDSVRLSIEESPSGGGTVRIHRADGGVIPSMYVDYALTACIFRMKWVVGNDVHPTRVRFRRSVPTDRSNHEQAFGPSVDFDQAMDEVVFDQELWSRPALAPDPGLREVLHRHAEIILAGLPTVTPLIERVRTTLEYGLPQGHSDLGRTAKELGLSPRTLQRRLSDAGLTWRELVEETRFAVSRAHLAEPLLSVEEIAVLVGYSEYSSFYRAFLRWSGSPPGVWRTTH
ncbi:MAG: AraC family transcriptional regulator [Deltaproteobacteria bacterium]|nr:AraC family transcriptional regulator [Deltaproteobacteria bacterium]